MTTQQYASIAPAVATTDDPADRRLAVHVRRQHTAAVALGALRDRLDATSDDDLVFLAHHGPDAEVRNVAHAIVRDRCKARLVARDLSPVEWAALYDGLIIRRTNIRAVDGRYLSPTMTPDEDMLLALGGAR